MSESLRVAIADDHPLFRMGLRYALSAQGFEVVAEVENGLQALQAAKTYRPDVVLLDVKMPEQDGLEACRDIRAQMPQVLVVMLSTFDEPAIIQAARVAGASAYFSKETAPKELAARLERIVANPTRDWFPRVSLPELTGRELDVLRLLANGNSNKEIARALGVSPETVKDHLNAVYRKLDVRDRLSALRQAQQLGLLSVELM